MLFPAATTSPEVPLSSEWTSPLGSSQVVGLYQHSWVHTDNSLTGQEPLWAGYFGFSPCWVATGSLTHSGHGSGTGWQKWWTLLHLSKEAPPSEPSLHRFPEGVHAGMIQLQSQPGSSVLEGQLCLLGLPSGQIRLGLSVCVMEVLKPEDRVTLLLPKNQCHLKYKLSNLLWDLCTVSRRNQYVQRTISCLHLRNFLWLPTPEMCGFPHWLQRQFLTSKPLHVCGGGDCLDTSRGKCATGHVSCKPSTSVNAYTHVKHKQVILEYV